jgi:integrase/recombinase XerD
MQKNQKFYSRIGANEFAIYKPAELFIRSQWLVVYYAKNPISNKMERFRVCVPLMKNKTERLKHAKKIVTELNKRLDSGWLPFYSGNELKEFQTFEFCKNLFLEQTKKEVANGSKRIDTLRSYTSFLSMIEKYITEKNIKLNLIFELNKPFVSNYLDWIYFERKNTERTYNNHLLFITTFVNYCIARGYLKEQITSTISRKTNAKKIREILTPIEKDKLKLLEFENYNYFTLCMATYFCFLRRTEITKIKVKDVNLYKSYISIDGKISKNRKTENVTIPNAFSIILSKHLQESNNDDFLFSDNNFSPGNIQLKPKRISDFWNIFRNKNNIGTEYQFYSLKDTGITDLLNSGIPAIKVRDQARHYDLKITESYTARNINCDDVVKNSNFKF